MQTMSQSQQANTQELSQVYASAVSTISENESAKLVLQSTVNSIQEIQKTSEKIASIISIIDGIAFQTNLLALNAAVEAARAGEHGRGFAVVAGEVRTLAQKSAEAAQDISRLIHESVAKVGEGVEKVEQTRGAFELVDDRVQNIGKAMQKVLGSIQEQQDTGMEIAQALNSLDSNIQSNAALVDQSSVASQALKQQALLLNDETSKFSIDDQRTRSLIQEGPDIFGVKMADVRQNLRIWRTSVQTYLNGITTEIDLDVARNPHVCSVGQSLAVLLENYPQMQGMQEYQVVDSLHKQQHQLVDKILQIMETKDVINLDQLKEKDQMLDQFVETTEKLDQSLAQLNQVLASQLV